MGIPRVLCLLFPACFTCFEDKTISLTLVNFFYTHIVTRVKEPAGDLASVSGHVHRCSSEIQSSLMAEEE